METPPGVQRLWRLIRPNLSCIGVIVDGYVPDITEPGATGFTALVSFAVSGESQRRVEPDGRVFYVSQWVDDKDERFGVRTETLAEALSELDALKATLLGRGWKEASLDVVNDPD